MPVIVNADGLSGAQIKILNILSKASMGMTAAEISHAGKIPVNSGNIGPVKDDVLEKYPESLRGREFVRAEQYEGDEVRWSITDKGRKIGSTFKGRKTGPNKKVDPAILDPVILAFKKTRNYGLESYTDEDMTEMRKKLGVEYKDVEIDDLRRQIESRRKQGAFKDPAEARKKSLQKALREFGPSGTVIRGFLTEDQVSDLYAQIGGDMSE